MEKPSQIEKPLDKESFEALFRLYFRPLTAFSSKFVKDTDIAKSIVHDVFVKLWEKREMIDVNKKVKSYLYTSVNNRSLNHIRDNKKYTSTESFQEHLPDSLSQDFNDTFTAAEIQQRISLTLDSLPPKCRKAFELSRFEHKKYKEIAEELGVSVKTIETHISKALKAMRKNLAEYLTISMLFILTGL